MQTITDWSNQSINQSIQFLPHVNKTWPTPFCPPSPRVSPNWTLESILTQLEARLYWTLYKHYTTSTSTAIFTAKDVVFVANIAAVQMKLKKTENKTNICSCHRYLSASQYIKVSLSVQSSLFSCFALYTVTHTHW